MDDLLKELRLYLADAPKRERAAEVRSKDVRDGFALVAHAIEEGFKLISHTLMDAQNNRR